MPTFVRYFIKTSIVYFVGSLLLGILLAASPVMELPVFLSSLFPTYLHLFVVGWITQMIFGVSIWMFPKPRSEGRYGNETVIWVIYATINAGLLVRLVAEPGNLVWQTSTIVDVGLVVSAVLHWLAAVAYVYHVWGRIR